MLRKFGQFSIHTQIVVIVAVTLLISSSLVSLFALRSTNSILRKEAIEAVGLAANARREALLAKLKATQTRTRSILEMSMGICQVQSSLSHSCLTKMYEHFRKVNQASALQYLPRHGRNIELGAPAEEFANFHWPEGGELARFDRSADGQVYYAVRVNDSMGELRAEFPESLIEPIFEDRSALGQSGESFLADGTGRFITRPRYGAHSDLSHPIETLPMTQCLGGKNSEILEKDYREMRVVHGFRSLPEIGGGCIMAHVDETEAFAKGQVLARQILEVTLVALGLALLLALVAANIITRPISRLVEKAKALQRGELIKDMLLDGPLEIQTFADAFSGMTKTLLNEIETRKMIQFESDRQKAQFEAIFNSISDPVIFVDNDRQFALANPAFYKSFGYSPDQLVGHSARMIYPSDEEFLSRGEIYKSHGSGEGKVYGISFKRANGEIFASETMVARVTDREEQSLGYVAIVRDISSVKEAQAQLQKSEERFRRAIMDAPIPIMLRANDGEVLIINKIWEEITGYTAAELPNVKEWAARAYGLQAAEQSRRIFSVVNSQERVDLGEFEIKTRFGKKLLWHFIVAPLGDLPDGRKVLISMASDITERKKAADELAKAVNSRDEFLATLSHELRTPMNIILGWLEILKTGQYDQPMFNQAIETLSRNASIQKDLIDDLLDVSRIISGKFNLARETVDFTRLVRDICDSVLPRAQQKAIGLQVTLEPEPTSIFVEGDRTKLSQVLTNLLHNSIKFTPRGGEIVVKLKSTDGVAHLEVCDTGVGIDPDFLPHVFDRLKQQDMGTTRAHSGLGLGLAISRHIVEQHFGKITAMSAGRDLGATFCIEFPLVQPKIVPHHQPVATEAFDDKGVLQGVHALIVDDSPDILFLLRTWLEQEGVTVTEAESAHEGLKILQTLSPDILLSDIGMPEQDGYEFIKQVRGLGGRLANIPAAALTAYAREEERSRAMKAGFQTHISKPTSKKAVLKAVVELLINARKARDLDAPTA